MDAPAVAVSRDGKKFAVAWMDMRRGRNERQVFASALDGAPEKPLADDPSGLKGHPSITMDDQAVAHFAWEDSRSPVQQIHYRRDGGKDVAISPDKGKASFPSLACGKVVGVAFEYGNDAVFVAVNE